ncbi:MAG: hypothetical protein OXN83_02780 [Oligoflexia bacterium]|nr:hypothetical protein [Oligoflexia bacterium]
MIKKLFFCAFLSFCCVPLTAGSRVSPSQYLKKVTQIIDRGDYLLGSRELYRLSRGSFYKHKRLQIKYTLGIAFLEMKLYHLASLQFVYVIRRDKGGKYKAKALEKLSFILAYFKNDLLFCPLSNQVREYDYPNSVRSQLNFYFGKCAFSKKNFKKARYHFLKVSSSSPIYDRAVYYRGLAYAEENKVKQSADMFRKLASLKEGVTDTNRVAALMGLARVLYQGEKFEDSIKVYRSIPRDTPYFYDSLLENSWNYLRSGKFRSALSNFQSLHSVFYADRYQPESLILRAYVYLYICKYYEMEKVLSLFNAVYMPILSDVKRSLRWGKNYRSYVKSALTYEKNRRDSLTLSDDGDLPKAVMDRIFKNEKFYSLINYLVKLNEEKALLDSFPAEWKRDRVGRNAYYILNRRIKTTQNSAGKEVRKILLAVRADLERLYTSSQYLKYDMLKGKREYLKKKISRKYLDKIPIDETVTRSYYIQNGYEYWPFDGEAWLDELGNYHYLGRQNCE